VKAQIVKLLQADALTSHQKLASMLGVSVEEIHTQVKELETDGVILGYRAVIDHDKVDHDLVRAAIEVKITPERDGGFDRIASRIAQFEEVQACYLMSGAYDLLVMVEGTDLKQVARFVSEKLSTIGGVLSTASHFVLKPYKESGLSCHKTQVQDRLQVAP
jgi:DNA-binding Lrp family transcriptional regulator